MAEPSGNRQAHRTRTLRMPAKTPLTSDNMDAPAACAVPFRPYCGGVVTRTRNVSEYMLVLAVCLVVLFGVVIHETNNVHVVLCRRAPDPGDVTGKCCGLGLVHRSRTKKKTKTSGKNWTA